MPSQLQWHKRCHHHDNLRLLKLPIVGGSLTPQRSSLMTKSSGFSLIEFTLILVIIGLISVIIYSPLATYTKQSRRAAVMAMEGTIRSACALSMLKYALKADPHSDKISMGKQTVIVNPMTGIPLGTAEGIGHAIAHHENGLLAFKIDYTLPLAVRFTPPFSKPNADCFILYNGQTGITTTQLKAC